MKWLLWLYTAIKMTTFQSKWESIVSCTDYGHKMSRFHILSDEIITQTQNSIKMSEKLVNHPEWEKENSLTTPEDRIREKTQ